MSIRMRHTKAHTGKRRSHHSLKEEKVSACSKCGSLVMSHYMCKNCGTYKGREVVDVMAKLTRKEVKAKEKELKASEENKRAGKPLDAADLSNK